MPKSAPHPDPTQKLVLSVDECCSALTIGRTTFYELVKDGRLKTVKIGRRTLVTKAAIAALLGA